jgi:hypothetical protein
MSTKRKTQISLTNTEELENLYKELELLYTKQLGFNVLSKTQITVLALKELTKKLSAEQ